MPSLPYFRLSRHAVISVLHGLVFYCVVFKVYAVKRIFQRLQCGFTLGRRQFAFPHGDAMPAHFGESALLLLVSDLWDSRARAKNSRLRICMYGIYAERCRDDRAGVDG